MSGILCAKAHLHCYEGWARDHPKDEYPRFSEAYLMQRLWETKESSRNDHI